ncbi:adenine phosphoribosyltransferase [Aquimarina sp. 2201CG1-2-11]|uniref:adenine phosphoribosyltransferase n=1 Tax=Aquimarina discodermiae TaxID=3231043 RepID=UPI00346199B6
MKLEKYIRDIADFPKPGILFKDITPLLSDPEALINCVNGLMALIPDDVKIDKVIGVESRGFIMGAMIAERLQAGFVPVRKKGKLPYNTKSISYGLEYGEDTLEIHIDAIKPGEKVLIHDDVLATGGTAEAVCKLVEDLGGVIVQCNFIMELIFLEGRAKLTSPVAALLKY